MRCPAWSVVAVFGGLFVIPALHSEARPTGAFPDPAGGRLVALAVPPGRTLAIDGRFGDWDLSAATSLWCFYRGCAYTAHVALMYDSQYLYLAARVSLPDRDYAGPRGHDGDFDTGDLVQMRLVTDPVIGSPISPSDRQAVVKSGRAATIALWRRAAPIVLVRIGLSGMEPRVLNPPGSVLVVASDRAGYAM